MRSAERGHAVCVGYRSNESSAESVVRRCRELGADATAAAADVASEAGVNSLFAAADGLGTVVGLINSAGIVAEKARVDEMDGERLRRMFEVNVVGTLLCCAAAVRRMSFRHGGGGGAIVNVSSAAARLGSPGEYVDYAASKGAVDTLTLGLAREVAGEGIRVNGVRPGLIHTDMHASGGQPDRIERLVDGIPMRRGGQPSEVADAIVWLCSDAASYVTGALLDVAGGR